MRTLREVEEEALAEAVRWRQERRKQEWVRFLNDMMLMGWIVLALISIVLIYKGVRG